MEPLEGYEIVNFEWEVQTSPEAPLYHVNGTVQDVVRYLKENDPTYELPDIPVPELGTRQSRVEPRQIRIDCFNWPVANGNAIQDGINVLAGGHQTDPGRGPAGESATLTIQLSIGAMM